MATAEAGRSDPLRTSPSPGPLLISLVAGAAGFVVNGFTLPVISGVVLIFGSVFPLAVALAHGPRYGLVAGLLAASRTYLLWGHPYGVISLGLEAAAVGWLARRRWVPLFSVVVYWLVVGLPFSAAIDVFLGIPNPVRRMILAKFLLHEMIAVLSAEVLLWVAAPGWLRSSGPRRPVRYALLRLFVPLFALPLCLLALIQGTSQARRQLQDARTRVEEAAVAAGHEVDDYVNTHVLAIRALAGSLEKAGPLEARVLEPHLELTHRVYGGFLTMIVADGQGVVVASHPTRALSGNPLPLRQSVGDREYFKAPLKNGRPFVSDVFLGRGFGQDPIVAISTPIRDPGGRVLGIAEGSLDLRALSTIGERPALATEILIVDRQDRVIHGDPHGRYAPLQDLHDSALARAARKGPASFLYTDDAREEAGATRYVAAWSRSGEGWRVFARQPLGVVLGAVERNYLVGMGLLILGIVASTLVARAAAAKAIRPLERLVERLRGFTPIDAPPVPPAPALQPDAPAEVAELLDGFEAMAARLRNTLRGLLPICSSCKRIRDAEDRWHAVEVYVHDHSEADFTHGICPDCAGKLFPGHGEGKAGRSGA